MLLARSFAGKDGTGIGGDKLEKATKRYALSSSTSATTDQQRPTTSTWGAQAVSVRNLGKDSLTRTGRLEAWQVPMRARGQQRRCLVGHTRRRLSTGRNGRGDNCSRLQRCSAVGGRVPGASHWDSRSLRESRRVLLRSMYLECLEFKRHTVEEWVRSRGVRRLEASARRDSGEREQRLGVSGGRGKLSRDNESKANKASGTRRRAACNAMKKTGRSKAMDVKKSRYWQKSQQDGLAPQDTSSRGA